MVAKSSERNTKGSAAPTNAATPANVTERIADRNKEGAGGTQPLQQPTSSSGAEQEQKDKKESGPCGLPKGCNIL
jgi:hypothetical protein